MCTTINPPNQICEDCRAIYLQGHNPGSLTFEQVDACYEPEILRGWASRCKSLHHVPQLCPADAAGMKAWILTQPPEPPC